MPQSFSKNYVHIVFSTKLREPFLHEGIRDRMFAYMGGICNQFGCCPIIIGGYFDHVHILCDLSRKIALMDLVEEVKSRSSRWIKLQDEHCWGFYWQRGYAAFSVNKNGLNTVSNYIANQKTHHQAKDFKRELLAYLIEQEMEYDERYMWD